MCAVQRRPKTFRLRDLHSARKFGVAGHTCQEVLRKGCLRFQVPERGSRLCLCEDGTEVTEDYFPGVPDDAELVLLTAGQTWGGYVSDIGRLLSVFQEPHTGAIQAVRQLLADERAPLRKKLLADLLQSASQNMEAETRAEDPPWFEGLESRFRNKSGYLRYSCESRIRGYLREVTTYASQVDVGAREEFLRVLGSMCKKLKAAQYHGSYFDRGAEASGRLCTPEGWFSCQGPFDLEDCVSKHSINPYSNRESRILFSTWNLDHISVQLCSRRLPVWTELCPPAHTALWPWCDCTWRPGPGRSRGLQSSGPAVLRRGGVLAHSARLPCEGTVRGRCPQACSWHEQAVPQPDLGLPVPSREQISLVFKPPTCCRRL
ncbi:PREDICTED: DNA fragmentation factor subunit beta isoform X4 [Chinchilla lanigera]|uniref:DNA fragmentation factor subunit beta isoform X4 n=1 Tax=Chinchilla lanigera TaxID=34839 RepID=UPI00038ED7A0|nr:PREDICTED: DNA fragmentation factor subunit beta isoform X4 [Chinchilla lanigera]